MPFVFAFTGYTITIYHSSMCDNLNSKEVLVLIPTDFSSILYAL